MPENPPPSPFKLPASALGVTAATTLLSACGGGGEGGAVQDPPPVDGPAPTEAQAARFLMQSSMGASRAEIASVIALGYDAWLEAQFARARSGTRWDWLKRHGYDASQYKVTQEGFDGAAWRPLLSAPDTLRQRVTLALSEILVVAIDGLSSGGGWKAFSAAAYLDLLEAHAFGNLRDLLGAVSLSPAMSVFLTFRANTKASPETGALPDENYARELMQLFTIGLVELNTDGTAKLAGGKPQETYGQSDIGGLARVFTGWIPDRANDTSDTPDFQARPLVQSGWRYETGAKTFLGTTIAENTSAEDCLRQALDALFAHPNVGPFWSRQLILRLVTSNPSPAYVARVASVFANDGQGVRGNLKAVIKAILLDDEARDATRISQAGWGKLREPILRVTAWARACGVSSPSDAWAMGDTSDASSGLGQAPLRSPTVFNFYRPGYVPPNTSIASAGLVAPEFQITSESSVVGFLNFFQLLLEGGVGDLRADYSALLTLADTSSALVDEVSLLLCAGQLGSASRATIVGAIDAMPSGTAASRLNRVRATLMLVMASPETLVQK
jgi:uncharacterized protein (DUF1800 family)